MLIVRSLQIKGKGEEPLSVGSAYIVIVAKTGKGESGHTLLPCIPRAEERPCRRPTGPEHSESILLQRQPRRTLCTRHLAYVQRFIVVMGSSLIRLPLIDHPMLTVGGPIDFACVEAQINHKGDPRDCELLEFEDGLGTVDVPAF